MKYIKYNKVALALASFCILFSTSCSDEFLDRIPTNNYTADTYYTSDPSVPMMRGVLISRVNTPVSPSQD